MRTNRVLFVEDSEQKRHKITAYLLELRPELSITEAWSYSDGSDCLETGHYDLVILDISLPTFDKRSGVPGGRFRTLAGRELARKILRRGIDTKILFITQYSSFSDKEKGTTYTFDELSDLFSQECGDSFVGMVFYDSAQSAWRDGIVEALRISDFH